MAPVYLIGLMDVPIDHPDKDFWKDRYVSEYTFREKESHDLLGEYASLLCAIISNPAVRKSARFRGRPPKVD